MPISSDTSTQENVTSSFSPGISTTATEKNTTAAPTQSTATEKNSATSGMNTQLEDRITRASQAHKTIKYYAAGAMAVGLIPIPLIDFVAWTGVQLTMVHSIAEQYQIPFERDRVQALLTSLLGGLVPTVISAPVASFSKAIPLIGQSFGLVSAAIIGGAATYAVGKVFIEHFESGGTFLDFDPDKMREHFQELYEEGKQFATQSANKI